MRQVQGILLLCLALAAPAFGQQEAGDTELQLQGSLSIQISGDQEDNGNVAVTWGRFFTETQEWGLSATGRFNEDGDLTGFGGPFYRLNFGSGDVVPYIGAAAQASFGDGGYGDGALVTFEGGSRFFLNRNMAFSVEGNTHYLVDDSDFADSIDILFGFSYFWAK